MTPQDKPQHNPSSGGGEHLLRKLIGGGAPKFPMVPDPSPTESSEREGAGSPSAPAATPPAGEPDSASSEAPLEVVTAYDKENAERFRRLKRKKWVGQVLGIQGEWSQTFYHQGDVDFSLRATGDGKFWALYTEGFVRKIQAVVEASRATCAEEVAAEAMQAVKDARGPYVDLVDDYRDLDPELFLAFQKVARQRSRLRKQALQANAGQPAAVASEPTVPSGTPAAPQPTVQVFPVIDASPQVPKDAVFLCKSDFPGDFILIKEEVTLYLHRADGKDTLWITSIERAAYAVGPVPTEGDVGSAGLRLVDTAMRTDWYFGCPEGEFVAGPVTKEQLYGTWELIQAEEERIRDQIIAEMGDRPLVALARELGLGPEPAGSNRASWVANCPGTNHFLCIQAESGEFGCGYCKVKGGLQELREFVASRGRKK